MGLDWWDGPCCNWLGCIFYDKLTGVFMWDLIWNWNFAFGVLAGLIFIVIAYKIFKWLANDANKPSKK